VSRRSKGIRAKPTDVQDNVPQVSVFRRAELHCSFFSSCALLYSISIVSMPVSTIPAAPTWPSHTVLFVFHLSANVPVCLRIVTLVRIHPKSSRPATFAYPHIPHNLHFEPIFQLPYIYHLILNSPIKSTRLNLYQVVGSSKLLSQESSNDDTT
jgi:hypothetical protein